MPISPPAESAGFSLRDLFDELAALPPAQREACIAERRVPTAMAERLRKMLNTESAPGGMLDIPVREALERFRDEQLLADALLHTEIGGFRTIDVLGHGGSSIVFRAERAAGEGIQRVALKLLQGALVSVEARRRFEREHAILARLSHPNIARLVEGGIGMYGLPYLAMELVEGEPITTYAATRALSIRSRLLLFSRLCHAVDAAHAAMVVHRDLKPSNVLVDARGEIKVLDFGIAKLVDEGDARTRTQSILLTPEYAAPEQYSNALPTTATDVFALGVMLAELLVGMPVTRAGPVSILLSGARTPPVPSGLPPADEVARALRGDLDAIIAKAIDEEPLRRYRTAGALAEDIGRHLAALPVLAHPMSTWYRTRKFVRRHRGGVLTTAAFLLATFASLGIALWQAQIARAEATRATEQTRRAEAVRDFLISVFGSAQANIARESRPTIEELISDATTRAIGDTTMSAETRVELLLSLAAVGETTGAFREQQTILDHIEGDVDQLFTPADSRWLRARTLRANLWTMGKIDGRVRAADAVALLEPLRAAMLERVDATGVEVLLAYAAALYGAQRNDDAQEVYLEARRLAARLPSRAEETVLVVDAYRAASLVYAQSYAEALAIGEDALVRWKAQQAAPDRELLTLLRSVSLAAEMTGDIPRAEALYREQIDVAERLHVRPHPDTAWAIGIYGSFLVAQSRYDDAEPHIVRALAMRRALLGDAHPDTLNAIAALGRLQAGRKQAAAALETFASGIAICRRAQVRASVCARLLGSHAQMLLASGDLPAALAETEEAIVLQHELTGPDSPQLVQVLGFHARVLLELRRHEDVLRVTDDIGRLAKRGGDTASKDIRYAQFRRAAALLELGRSDESLETIAKVIEAQKRLSPKERATLFEMLVLRARAQASLADIAAAAASADEAMALEAEYDAARPALRAILQKLTGSARAHQR